MELGIRLSFVKTSEFRRGFEHPKPPPRHATAYSISYYVNTVKVSVDALHYIYIMFKCVPLGCHILATEDSSLLAHYAMLFCKQLPTFLRIIVQFIFKVKQSRRVLDPQQECLTQKIKAVELFRTSTTAYPITVV